MHNKVFIPLYKLKYCEMEQNQKTITVDYLLRNAWNAIAKMYNDQAAYYDTTMVYGLTLLSIDPKKGSPSMSLGPKMGIEPTSLSRTLTKLEKEGYIYRESHQDDKRIVLIKLTKEGLRMRDISKDYVLNFQTRINERISEIEMEHLRTALSKIHELTNEINQELQLSILHKKSKKKQIELI